MSDVIEENTVFSKGQHKNGPLYNLKKYIVWCVRNRKDNNHHSHPNCDSGPCNICIKRLLKLGFVKMGFTDSEGNMNIVRLDKYTGYYTWPQINFKNEIII